jgi:hypothetical protein
MNFKIALIVAASLSVVSAVQLKNENVPHGKRGLSRKA